MLSWEGYNNNNNNNNIMIGQNKLEENGIILEQLLWGNSRLKNGVERKWANVEKYI